MPTTRSATKQTRLEEFSEGAPGDKVSTTANSKTEKSEKKKPNDKPKRVSSQRSTKRKASSQDDDDGNAKSKSAPAKRGKENPSKSTQQHFAATSTADLEKPIIINRSPVLQLWAASVAHFVHPDLPWEACLSVGNAISALCAVSKGRSIGMIDPPDDSKSDERKERKRKTESGTKVLEVMGFPLHLKGNQVMISGKPKDLKEGNLRGKFGGEEAYERTRNVMDMTLQSWKGDEEELGKKAFHMYERFRPNVAPGQTGWGRKGELNLKEVESMIKH